MYLIITLFSRFSISIQNFTREERFVGIFSIIRRESNELFMEIQE